MSRPVGSKNKVKEENGGVTEVIDAPAENVQSATLQRGTIPEKIKKQLLEEHCHERDGRWYSAQHDPLCLTCFHKQDKHHEWDYYEVIQMVRNLYNGRIEERKIQEKKPNYERNKPCQYACKCTEYK